MDDIKPANPGKLKKKSKRIGSSSQSVVSLPAISADRTATNASATSNDNGLTIPSDQPQSATRQTEPPIALKIPDDQPQSSPLDALPAQPAQTSETAETQPAAVGNPGSPETSNADSRRIRLSKPPQTKTTQTDNLSALIEKALETQQKCNDTLSKLQQTNLLNQRRYTLNLTVAFIVIAAIAVIAVIIVTKLNNAAKFNDLKFKHETYTNTLNAKTILEDEFEKEKLGSKTAFEIYQKLEEGFPEEAIQKFNASRNAITHPAELALLEQKINETRWFLAENAFHEGVMLFNASNFEQARDAFFKSLAYKENAAFSPRLQYFLAMSLYQLADFEGAYKYFKNISNADLGSDMDANARFYFAMSAEKTGLDAEAYELFSAFLKKFRYHKFADDAAKHRAKLEPAKQK